jgi:hypothetical protein
MPLFRRRRRPTTSRPPTAVLSERELVWNRAAMEEGGSARRAGDAALAAMLSVHNIAMNGGLLHSVEHHTDAELDEGISGYRYFGLGPAADVVEWVRSERRGVETDEALDALEAEADRRYGEVLLDLGGCVRGAARTRSVGSRPCLRAR